MRFLIDNALAQSLADALNGEGHDAVHVRALGLASAADSSIAERAATDDRVVVSADTDFGALLALRQETRPSFILFRCTDKRTPALVRRLLPNLARLEDALEAGAIVVIEDERIRVRQLPI